MSVKLVEISGVELWGTRRPDGQWRRGGRVVCGCGCGAAIDGMADCAASAVPLSSPAPDGAPLRGCGA